MGFEPTTSAVTGRRSNQLSHRAKSNKVLKQPSKLHTGYEPFWISSRPISISQLNTLLYLHP